MYKGDDVYSIALKADGKNNFVIGDDVRLERKLYHGDSMGFFRTGEEIVTGRLVRESWGLQNLTVFIQALDSGLTIKIDSRNLYRYGTYRKPWPDELARQAALDEWMSTKKQKRDAVREAAAAGARGSQVAMRMAVEKCIDDQYRAAQAARVEALVELKEKLEEKEAKRLRLGLHLVK